MNIMARFTISAVKVVKRSLSKNLANTHEYESLGVTGNAPHVLQNL
jgi:hypothetical protein